MKYILQYFVVTQYIMTYVLAIKYSRMCATDMLIHKINYTSKTSFFYFSGVCPLSTSITIPTLSSSLSGRSLHFLN